MYARIVGSIDLDEFIRPAEIDAILGLEYNDNYSHFVFGSWRNCVLWNGSGAARDCDFHEYEGAARPTDLIAPLTGVQSLLRTCFDVDRVRWVRVFMQDGGTLLPHVDFVGMQDGFIRLHVPLRTNPGCMHSEENEVYHMRAGEIWYVEASRVHSAGNLSSTPRVSLCFDFAVGGSIESLVQPRFRAGIGARQPPMPHLIEREPFGEPDRLALLDLAHDLRHDTFDDVIAKLIRVHFEKAAPASAMFGWLADIAAASGNPELVTRAQKLRELALGA